MVRSILILLFLAIAGASNASAGEIEISNTRFGLICPEREPAGGSVCVETADIPVTGRGVCVYAGRERSCTWYGFEFDYANVPPSGALACVVTTDQPMDYGDPRGVRARNTNRFEFTLKLEGSAGHFFNPQYEIVDPSAAPDAARASELVCSDGAREVLRFQWTVLLGASQAQPDP